MNEDDRRLLLQILLPVALLVLGVVIYVFITGNPPAAEKQAVDRNKAVSVAVQSLQAQRHQIILDSYGTVMPRTQTTLVAQVSGVVTAIAESFRSGGYFKKGDVLLRIDDRDYRIAVQDAEAPLLGARAKLAEEQARAQRAKEDWESLKRTNTPSALVLRKPQVDAARAEVLATEARLERAKLDLSRTQIIAPYDGRVHSTRSDVGQFVNSSSELGMIFANDVLEVRLPLNRDQLQHIQLPEPQQNKSEQVFPEVLLSVNDSSTTVLAGRVVRADSTIDTSTRQLFVVAEITAPFTEGETALKIGQFVEARIHGNELERVYVVPRRLLLPGDELLLAKAGKVVRRVVNVLWRGQSDVVINGGLAEGELLIITPMRNAIAGMSVSYPGSDQP